MAKIERKAYYVGIWREDVVTDTTMRQIIARSQAEKGQKVKVKLSKDGLAISKTVLFQENFLSSFPLRDVYFLTVNHRHPTCLLCIVADPVRKYLIQALRTCNTVEAQELISTFQSLKENPTINAGNVVLRRKDNGNWTLRERSQHNADRHLQEIFKENDDDDDTTTNGTSTTITTSTQPNGYAPVIDGRTRVKGGFYGNGHGRPGSLGDADERELKAEMDGLSQELQEIKMVLEETGKDGSKTANNHNHHQPTIIISNNNNTDKSLYVSSDPAPQTNGGVVRIHSSGSGTYPPSPSSRPGEARAAVEDHRQDGVVRAMSAGTTLTPRQPVVIGNGRVQQQQQRQITVPPQFDDQTHVMVQRGDVTDSPADIPAYTVHRRVSTEFVQVPEVNRKLSGAESVRSSLRVKFDPESVRRSQNRHHQFRSLRTSRSSGVPSTIVRPIEEIYRPHPVGLGPALVVRPRPSILKRPAPQPPAPPPGSQIVVVDSPSQLAQHVDQAVYVSQPIGHHPQGFVTLPPQGRRSRPSSVHVMQGNDLQLYKTGEIDDVLL